jgi:vesicle-fusing ATPase
MRFEKFWLDLFLKPTKMVLIFRSVLEEMEMLSAFTAVLHVPNLSEPKHLLNVLEESDAFTKQEVATIARSIEGRRYSKFKNASIITIITLLLQTKP